MEKSKKLNSFCNKCQTSAVTNERIKKSFDYICYLDSLINGGGGEGGVTNAEYDEQTNTLKITFLDGSEKQVVIPSANGLTPSVDNLRDTSWYLKEAGTENRLPRGRGAIDMSPFNASGSAKGIYDVHFGTGNDSFADFGYNFIAGEDNEVLNSYYNAIVFGFDNKVTGGYQPVVFGYNNDVNTNRFVGGSMAFGQLNKVREYAAKAFGDGLIAKTKGTTVVGEGNTDYPTTGAQDPNRPMFIVGIGFMSVSRGSYGTVTERKDGLVVRKSGEVEAPELTTTLFDNDTTGKIIPTKEVIQQKLNTPLKPNENQEYSYGEGVFYQRVTIELTGSKQQQFNTPLGTGIVKVLKIEVPSVDNNALETMDSLSSLSNKFNTSDKPTFTLRSLIVSGTAVIGLESEVLLNPSTTETFSGEVVNIDVYYNKN